nr:hypothetical protein [Mucilaginibacter sp. E4BP6]
MTFIIIKIEKMHFFLIVYGKKVFKINFLSARLIFASGLLKPATVIITNTCC